MMNSNNVTTAVDDNLLSLPVSLSAITVVCSELSGPGWATAEDLFRMNLT